MIIKNYEILNIYSALNTIMTHKLPISVGWKFRKNINLIKEVFEEFAKSEQNLVSQYSLKENDNIAYKDDGQPEILPKYREIFRKEHNELLNCENEINFIMIKLSDLLYTQFDGEKTEREIEPTLLLTLDSMIIDDLEE